MLLRSLGAIKNEIKEASISDVPVTSVKQNRRIPTRGDGVKSERI